MRVASARGRPRGDVAGGAQMLEQRFRLEENGDRPVFGRDCVDSAAADADGAGIGREEAGNEIEQSGFARAAGAADGGDLAGRGLHGEMIGRGTVAEADILKREHG